MSSLSEIKNESKVFCDSAPICSGCQYLDAPYDEQKKMKIEHLQGLLSEAQVSLSEDIVFFSAGMSHLRDRLDFSYEDGRLGLYHKTQREIVDLPLCVQLSPPLQEFLESFRQLKWRFKKASVRLRVSPQGKRGVWLDLANIDIKQLLEEKKDLHFLQEMAFVEMGQRRKVPVYSNGQFKLQAPQQHPWFQTWVSGHPIDLYCQVASFTQPSHLANKLICSLIEKWISRHPGSRLLEFGSGIGNLTLPAASTAAHVVACEVDALALEGFRKTLQNLPASLTPLQQKIEIYQGDFQRKISQDFSDIDGVLVNPPRSGLINFLEPLKKLSQQKLPLFFIYMSCFPESMMKDMKDLISLGYEVQEMNIVDQFPQTKHYEVLSFLTLKKKA